MTFRNEAAGILPILFFFLGTSFAQAPAPAAPPVDSGPLYVVTYLEEKPGSAKEAASLLKAYRDMSRVAAGNMRSIALQRIDRPGQFAMVTTWKDNAAWQAHMAAGRTKELRDKLAALRTAPADDRLNSAFSVGSLDEPKAAGAVHVVTHVDVIPPYREATQTALKILAEANRRANGNLHFEVVQQTSRLNHFTVFETWRSRAAFEANTAATPQVGFRDQLGPMTGALYDERLYKLLD